MSTVNEERGHDVLIFLGGWKSAVGVTGVSWENQGLTCLWLDIKSLVPEACFSALCDIVEVYE